jgi:hypothetical protein
MSRNALSRPAGTVRARRSASVTGPTSLRASRPIGRAGGGPVVTGTASRLLDSPGSLTQVPQSATRRCPVCDGTRLTRIAMVLTDGSPVDFTSCHHCEHKSWVHDGAALPIDTVLDRARKQR